MKEDREILELQKALLLEQNKRIFMEYQLNQSATKEVDAKLAALGPPEADKEPIDE